MENISKIVVSKNDGRRIGYVLDIAVNLKNFNFDGYYVVDEESEAEFFLPISAVLAISDQFVVIEDVSKLEFSGMRNSLLGKTIIDDSGNDYGVVREILFLKNKVQKFVTSKCEILPKNIQSVGADFIFVTFSKKRKSHAKEVFKRVEPEIVVSIQSKPEKINLSNEFYVGKAVKQDVFGYNNERIIAKGETITKHAVEKAKKHNKLNELFFAIKR